MEAGTVITVTFEDHGQDFLEWDICNGVVVDCRPFQVSVWVNCRLVEPMWAQNIGHRPLILTNTEGLGPMRINYPAAAVAIKAYLAEEIPCFLCGEDVPASIALKVTFESKDGQHEGFTAFMCPICREDYEGEEE